MTDQIAIITGTSSGIGEALAEKLLSQGWHVIGISRTAVDWSRPEYQHIRGDLGDLDSLTSTVIPKLEEILRGRAWIRMALINNAASTGQLRDLEQSDSKFLAKTLAINTVAPVALMGVAARICPTDTPLRIVNLSTGLAHFALPGCGDYCISKAGLYMAGQVFASEHENTGNSQRAILSYSPGTVATKMQKKLRHESDDNFSSVQMFKDFHSEGKLVMPEDILEPITSFLDDNDPPVFSEVVLEIGQSAR
jgi:benzil reductase ((S)-benzoin forming)